jgi:DNA-binding response OmpR family regulator
MTGLRRLCAFCVTNDGALADCQVMARVLLVEDDAGIRAALGLALEDEGYDVSQAPNGRLGLAHVASEQPDIVLLDLRLPDVSGFEVCREIRQRSNVPIIIVTAQTDTHDLVAGLEAGADDYVTKPVNTKELAARIRAALRRLVREASGRTPDVVRFGDVELRRDAGTVSKAGAEVALTKTELRLLIEFIDHPNMVLSRDQLLERVWGYDYLGDSRLVDAHIRRLRVKIEDAPNEPRFIVTARGLGYRFQAEG